MWYLELLQLSCYLCGHDLALISIIRQQVHYFFIHMGFGGQGFREDTLGTVKNWGLHWRDWTAGNEPALFPHWSGARAWEMLRPGLPAEVSPHGLCRSLSSLPAWPPEGGWIYYLPAQGSRARVSANKAHTLLSLSDPDSEGRQWSLCWSLLAAQSHLDPRAGRWTAFFAGRPKRSPKGRMWPHAGIQQLVWTNMLGFQILVPQQSVFKSVFHKHFVMPLDVEFHTSAKVLTLRTVQEQGFFWSLWPHTSCSFPQFLQVEELHIWHARVLQWISNGEYCIVPSPRRRPYSLCCCRRLGWKVLAWMTDCVWGTGTPFAHV